MTLLIDADSLVYVIAWNYREIKCDAASTGEVHRSCENMLRDLMTITQAETYIGAFSCRPCFRNEAYRYKPYKGNRPDKPDWIRRWEPVITKYFMEEFGFVCIPNLEADDVVSGLADIMEDCMICSPDKDLRTRPGRFYIPGKGADATGTFKVISENEAHRTFWLQMIEGDDGDNVAGIPGLGASKGAKILDACLLPMGYASAVQAAYQKYFGDYYGGIIFLETLDTLRMMCREHRLWEKYADTLHGLVSYKRPMPARKNVVSDLFA